MVCASLSASEPSTECSVYRVGGYLPNCHVLIVILLLRVFSFMSTLLHLVMLGCLICRIAVSWLVTAKHIWLVS